MINAKGWLARASWITFKSRGKRATQRTEGSSEKFGITITLLKSAPAASNLGLMVTVGESSAERTITQAGDRGCPLSGSDCPLLIRAASSKARVDLPTPG